MVIDDLDDHGLQMMTGRTKNARIRSGSTPGPLKGKDDTKETPAPLPWQGRHLGQVDVPKDNPRDATDQK